MKGNGTGITPAMKIHPPIRGAGSIRRTVTILLAVLAVVVASVHPVSADGEGPVFPPTITIEDRDLTLNGVGHRTYLWYRVITAGLYLERPTQDARVVIASEQIKSLHEYFRPPKVYARWIRRGVVKLLTEHNPEGLVQRHREDIDRFASWFNGDARAGTKVVITYIPGTGLTLEYDGVVRGTIAGGEFARMYFRSIFGDDADKRAKRALLGMK